VETRLIKTHYELQLKTAEVEKMVLENHALANRVKRPLRKSWWKTEGFEAGPTKSLIHEKTTSPLETPR
jgi:hypothetical protein